MSGSDSNDDKPQAAPIGRRTLLAGVVATSAAAILGGPSASVAQQTSAAAASPLEVQALTAPQVAASLAQARVVKPAVAGDPALGQLTQLPGIWQNVDDLIGHGWNMIALPYKTPGNVVQPDTPDQKSPFRLLLNQFNETLAFSIADEHVPNRGAALAQLFDADQHLAALEYHQKIDQIASIDFPATADTPDTPKGGPATIHREPGLFLSMPAVGDVGPQIARLATIPHGDSVLALGTAVSAGGAPDFASIGDFTPLPVGVNQDVDQNPYLAPYKTFRDAPFKGIFNPLNPIDLLSGAIANLKIKNTTTIILDSDVLTGGIHNVPFVSRQANASAIRAAFFIEELEDKDKDGNTQLVLQYIQRVFLDFFPVGGAGGPLIRWPHITVNTMKLTGAAATSLQSII